MALGNQFQFLSLLLSFSYIAIIISCFIAFRSENRVFCVLVFILGLALSGAINIVFKMAYNITKYSAEFLHNFAISSNQGRDGAEDRRFFKSCLPLYVNIGEYSRISRNMFPTVMHEIIINTIISLLLTIPS